MLDKIKKLMELQGKVKEIKKELEAATVEAEADNGRIKIVMSGEQTVKSVNIAAELLHMANKDKLDQELANCMNQAIKKSQRLATEKFQSATGLNLPNV